MNKNLKYIINKNLKINTINTNNINNKINTINTNNKINTNNINNKININNTNNTNKKIIIIVSKNIETIALNIKKFLYEMKIDCEIKFNISEEELIKSQYMNIIYLFIHTSMIHHNMLPHKFIVYQVEQSTSNWFTKKYLNYLQKSNYIWEFSMKNKILYNNIDNINIDNKITYMLMPFYYEKLESSHFDKCEFDIFFYGTCNVRRKNILNILSKKYNIKIGFSLYGQLKEEMIKKSKIILNLHYYRDCALESCRLNEILQYNKIIISEKPTISDKDNQQLYENLVIFIDEISDNLVNLEQLYEKINFYLDKTNYMNYLQNSDIYKNELHIKSKKNLEKNIEKISFY